jgi:hypothetical protein
MNKLNDNNYQLADEVAPTTFETDWLPYVKVGTIIVKPEKTEKYTKARLQSIVDNYDPIRYINAPLMVGHTDDDFNPLVLRQSNDKTPRYGDISQVKLEDNRFWYKLKNLSRQAYDWIKSGAYNQISWEIWDELDDKSIPCPQLTGIALLGANIPAVAGATITLSNSFKGKSTIETFNIAEIENNQIKGGTNMPDVKTMTEKITDFVNGLLSHKEAVGDPPTPPTSPVDGAPLPDAPKPAGGSLDVAELQKQLSASDALCKKLQAQITNLMATIDTQSAELAQSQQDAVMQSLDLPDAVKQSAEVKLMVGSLLKDKGKIIKLSNDDGTKTEKLTVDIVKTAIETIYKAKDAASKMSNTLPEGRTATGEDEARGRYKQLKEKKGGK